MHVLCIPITLWRQPSGMQEVWPRNARVYALGVRDARAISGGWGSNCVGKVLLKSQCKKYGIWKGKIKPHLGKVCIFTNTVLQKS